MFERVQRPGQNQLYLRQRQQQEQEAAQKKQKTKFNPDILEPPTAFESPNTVQKKSGKEGTGQDIKSNSKLPEDVQAKMENSFGTSFTDVNIHTNDKGATDLGALAYTRGKDVHFAPGQFNPKSKKGQELIGHELTHVVQQKEGKVKSPNIGDMPIVPPRKSERQLKREELDQDYKESKKGSSAKMQFQLKYGKEGLASNINQQWFNSYAKGQSKQLKRNKNAAHAFRAKTKAFERQLKRDNISFNSDEYIQRAKDFFPGFDPVSPLLKADPNFQVNEDKALEHEADVMGKKVADGKTVNSVKTGKGLQLKEGENDPDNKYESYKNKAYTLSKDSKISSITEKDGKEKANRLYDTEKKFEINGGELIPAGLKVNIVSTDFSYEKSGKGFARKEVAKVTIVDEKEPEWNNKTVWTTRTNISKEAAENGCFTIVTKNANTRKEGVDVKGKQKTIPKDSKIELTDYKTIGSRIYVRAISKETKEDYGWINVKDLGKDIYNESFGIEKAKYISEAHNHGTINLDGTRTYKQSGFHYPEIKENKKRVLIKKGDKVQVGASDGKYVEVLGLTIPGYSKGWTAKSNLKQEEGENLWLVTSTDARLRSKEIKYVDAGKKLSAGQLVIEKETSLDANPDERYVKVSIAEKKDGEYIEKEGSEAWIKQEKLTSKWADAKGQNATWENIGGKAVYTGQIDLVKTMGSGPQMEYMKADSRESKSDMYIKYKGMADAACSEGVDLGLVSGFRTYGQQKYLRDKYLEYQEKLKQGESKANLKKYNLAALPGKSKHQIGIAVDLDNKNNTKANIWLMKNAYRFGFVRPLNKGYEEAHHWEYRPSETREPKNVEVGNKDKKETSKRYYFGSFSLDNDKEWKTHKWWANCYDE